MFTVVPDRQYPPGLLARLQDIVGHRVVTYSSGRPWILGMDDDDSDIHLDRQRGLALIGVNATRSSDPTAGCCHRVRAAHGSALDLGRVALGLCSGLPADELLPRLYWQGIVAAPAGADMQICRSRRGRSNARTRVNTALTCSVNCKNGVIR